MMEGQVPQFLVSDEPEFLQPWYVSNEYSYKLHQRNVVQQLDLPYVTKKEFDKVLKSMFRSSDHRMNLWNWKLDEKIRYRSIW